MFIKKTLVAILVALTLATPAMAQECTKMVPGHTGYGTGQLLTDGELYQITRKAVTKEGQLMAVLKQISDPCVRIWSPLKGFTDREVGEHVRIEGTDEGFLVKIVE